MAHLVYRSLNRPILILGIDYRLFLACGASVVLCYFISGKSFGAATVWALVVYQACRRLTKQDLLYPLFWIYKHFGMQMLDPMEHSGKPGIYIDAD